MDHCFPHKDTPGTDIFPGQGRFFIVRAKPDCYLQTEDPKSRTGITIWRLTPACQGGGHYLGAHEKSNIYIIKGDSDRVVKDLSTDAEAEVHELHPNCHVYFSIHPNMLNFFPGDWALTKGASTGGWECIKTLQNDADSSIIWADKVTHKVGYAKPQMSRIEHKWSISAEMSLGTGALTKLIIQFQFSFRAE